jgi:hypothetical protein
MGTSPWRAARATWLGPGLSWQLFRFMVSFKNLIQGRTLDKFVAILMVKHNFISLQLHTEL